MTHTSASRRSESGFAIVAILVMVGVISMVAATYSRHVLVHARSSGVTETVAEAQEIMDSQVEYVISSQASGHAVSESTLLTAVKAGAIGKGTTTKGDHDMSFTVDSVAADRVSMTSRVLSDLGVGATQLIEAGLAPRAAGDDPDDLPQVSEESLDALLNDFSIPIYAATTDVAVRNATIEGIIVVKNGVELTLEDVVIEGSILSHGAILGWSMGPFDDYQAPTLTVHGSVRIRSGEHLEGIAVMMPDGVFQAGSPDARVSLEGDVVAHDVQLDCHGSVRGQLAAVGGANVSNDVEQVGTGRGDDGWSDVIDSQDAWDTTFLAIVPRKVAVDELPGITGYQFPAKASVDEGGVVQGGGSAGR